MYKERPVRNLPRRIKPRTLAVVVVLTAVLAIFVSSLIFSSNQEIQEITVTDLLEGVGDGPSLSTSLFRTQGGMVEQFLVLDDVKMERIPIVLSAHYNSHLVKNQTGIFDPVSSAKSYSFIEAYQSDPVTFDSDIMMNMGFSVEASTMWVIEELSYFFLKSRF